MTRRYRPPFALTQRQRRIAERAAEWTRPGFIEPVLLEQRESWARERALKAWRTRRANQELQG